MATAHTQTNVTSLAGFAAASLRNDRAPIREDWPGPWPNRYAVREIDCTLVTGNLEFSFRNPAPAQALPAGGLADVINLVRQPSNPNVTSRHTPLDIGVFGDSAYIFLKIVGPANMRFSPSQKAMTHKNEDDRDGYGQLRHVNATMVSEDELDDCKIIYFIIDPLAPPTLDYKHGFNLNVELVQQPGPGGEPRVLAFEIDPDIRYPGGSPT